MILKMQARSRKGNGVYTQTGFFGSRNDPVKDERVKRSASDVDSTGKFLKLKHPN
jgi:hypothetical protein